MNVCQYKSEGVQEQKFLLDLAFGGDLYEEARKDILSLVRR